jgi:general secretion pathway protein J
VNVPLHADRRSGFTLVELLVSLVVLSLIALIMVSGLRFVVRAVASTDSRREALEELTLGLSVLRGELERAEPLMQKVGQRQLVLFEGTPDRLRFVNVEPPYLAGPPYLTYEYAVTLDDGSYRIDLSRAPFDPEKPSLAVVGTVEPRLVLRVGQALQFSYFGKLRDGDRPAWHGEWPTSSRLPDAIRLAQGEDPGWPDLVVAMRITAPWYCGGADAGSTAGCPGAKEGKESLLPPAGGEVKSGSGSEPPFGSTGGTDLRRSREPRP